MQTPLIQLDGRAIAPPAGSHSAFMVVRNESQRLPYCIDYHRTLGIDRFFVVDNGSDDETREFLLSQPDCHVFHADGSFAAANYGMTWINRLVELYGIGAWCLFIDADELFTYPHSEKVSLPAFCRFLDRRKSEGVFSLLLDMYGANSVADAVYERGMPFLATAPHFDRHYEFRQKFSLSRNGDPLVATEAVGGPRLRTFYPEFRDAPPWKQAVWRAIRRARRHPLGAAVGLRKLPAYGIAPDLTKIPLIKARSGLSWVSNHRCTELRLSEITGALLHFKFFSDFHDRARIEAARAQHWDGGAEYVRYASLVETDPKASLFFAGSGTYRSTQQLVDLGLMRSSTELNSLAGCRTNIRRERRLRDYATPVSLRRAEGSTSLASPGEIPVSKSQDPA
jgi:glycosyltransferase involved in cell wall biosynthesis